jgi:hypothetical protein
MACLPDLKKRGETMRSLLSLSLSLLGYELQFEGSEQTPSVRDSEHAVLIKHLHLQNYGRLSES